MGIKANCFMVMLTNTIMTANTDRQTILKFLVINNGSYTNTDPINKETV